MQCERCKRPAHPAYGLICEDCYADAMDEVTPPGRQPDRREAPFINVAKELSEGRPDEYERQARRCEG